MKQLNIKCKTHVVRYRSYKGDVGKTAPNIINGDFHATKPNMKWATDVTQANINNEKYYLSPIMNMFNGVIIAFSILKRQHFGFTSLCTIRPLSFGMSPTGYR